MLTPRPLRLSCAIIAFLASVTVAAAQSAPQGLTSTVNGSTVTLNWSAASGAASYLVEASLSPGGLPVASLPVGGTTLTVPNVPSGNYYVRVRAVAGGLSVPSNEILVTVGSTGCPAAPLPPRLEVRSTGLQASASWVSGGGCAPTSYTLFAGSAPGQSDITVVNAGGQLGVAATAPPGNYYVRVLGSNAFGSAMSEELLLRVAVNAQSDTVGPNGAVAFDVLFTQTGGYQGTLVWSDPAIDLDLYLTTPGCSYPPTNCLLAISDGTVGNTEQVSYGVSAGQSLRLWIDNFSTRTSSFTIFNTISGNPQPVGDEPEDTKSELTIKKNKP